MIRDSWLARRHPLVKAAAVLAVSIAVLFLFRPLPILVLYTTALAGVRAAGRVPWRTIILSQIPFLSFAMGIVLVNAMSRPGLRLWATLPVPITIEGLSIGAALALRAMLIGVLTVGFLATTRPRDLMISLIQNLHLSPRYAYAILSGHRMLEAMPTRWTTIRAAQAVRAPLTRRGAPRQGVKSFARAAFALLVTSIRSSERIALALESRGLGRTGHTIRDPMTFSFGDLVLLLATMCVFALTVILV
ncbi:energy-coupling factor transporter transmembrane component T [Actinobaculum sp. 352]|uniref:energy-coupling factor transporter transmembrane component T family protein n=1 Tax=Actinobaculum sp. 352 TaxID=2490946 RepID=UPI000F7F1951|nr:energy-coupling factor transporter transmembrane component T [Actinobaculum sp. 352]RTE48518.1 energy-coupling factor transporter transmembrane protein EcfT [Actinobaculum sp. 352]